MFKKTKLAKAVAMTLAGTAVSIAGISSASAGVNTMYNLTTGNAVDISSNTINPISGGVWGLNDSNRTDGWLNGFNGASDGSDNSLSKWAGTTGTNKNPFGYTGTHLNWGMEINSGAGGRTGEISTFDSFNRYGVYADIDTAQGAWSDAANGGNLTARGWKHNLEFGLIKSDISGQITLNAEGILQSGTNFGFTIFEGMNTNTTYGHHGNWNANNNITGLNADSLPPGTTLTISDIVAYSVGGPAPTNLNTISFNAEAGKVYTVVMGGFKNGSWNSTVDGYKLTVSQVPVPAAAWLMGTGLLGLVGMRRKNKRLSA